MTVVSVIGLINSKEVICTQSAPDEWDCNPGETPDGRYVAEFWATDESGNVGYKLAIVYLYDGKCVKIEWIEDNVTVKFINDNFDIGIIYDSFDVAFVNTSAIRTLTGLFVDVFTDIDYEPDRFDISIIKCEGVPNA